MPSIASEGIQEIAVTDDSMRTGAYVKRPAAAAHSEVDARGEATYVRPDRRGLRRSRSPAREVSDGVPVLRDDPGREAGPVQGQRGRRAEGARGREGREDRRRPLSARGDVAARPRDRACERQAAVQADPDQQEMGRVSTTGLPGTHPDR